MVNLILPVAGRSSRFPDLKPKWMLTHPRGNMMLIEAIKGLDFTNISNIYVIGLEEHEKKYKFCDALSSQFSELNLLDRVHYIQLPDQTRHQPETIAFAIKQGSIDGPIYIKDSDNYFVDYPKAINSVSAFDLHHLETVNARNKSYLELNSDGQVVNIVEKKIISSTFCAGGYSFESASSFMRYYYSLQNNTDLYISHIIYAMLLNDIGFNHSIVQDYQDWGTISEWNNYKKQYATLFVDLDGTLVENSGQFGCPKWGETDALEENVKVINALYDTGKFEVIITTSRKEDYHQITVNQLERLGIRYHRIIFGLVHGRRIVINDYAKSNPYKSCDAINLQRNRNDLKDLLEESIGFRVNV